MSVKKSVFRLPKKLRTSSHKVGQALLTMDERPVRAFTLGRFTVTWDGKAEDVRPVVPTSHIFRNVGE